jgi:ectoine hydroxylase
MSAASQQSPISADPALRLTAEERAAFDRDGFVIRRGFVTEAELAPLAEACLGDPEIDGALVGIADSQGNMQEVVTWTDLTQPDMLTVYPRVARFVDAAEDLLGRPVYHWHSKLSMKRPGSAGRWDWHQDYAYWYHEGCLYPDMLTVTIAVDRTDEANGCLKLIAGSHKLGRIEHNRIGMASGVDPERLALIEQRHRVVACDMEAGDTVFFHANTLHASGPNLSDRPRTLLHMSYNAIDNSPFVAAGQDHHKYKPLAKMPDDALIRRDWKTVLTGQPFWSRSGEANGSRSAYGYTLLRPARPKVAR